MPRLYAIADQEILGGERLGEVAEALATAGVGWIQLRLKRASGAEAYRWVEEVVRRLEGSAAALWINDRADLAALFPVAGVHVGQDDLPPRAVRRVIGAETWIGLSTHDLEELAAGAADPEVDLVAVGPVFATQSKQYGAGGPPPAVGLELVRRARAATSKPVVAIGGIDSERLPAVLAAGADSVALIGALGSGTTAEIAAAARRLLRVAEEVQ